MSPTAKKNDGSLKESVDGIQDEQKALNAGQEAICGRLSEVESGIKDLEKLAKETNAQATETNRILHHGNSPVMQRLAFVERDVVQIRADFEKFKAETLTEFKAIRQEMKDDVKGNLAARASMIVALILATGTIIANVLGLFKPKMP